MKQRIAVCVNTPTGGFGLRIEEVYQLENQLIVVTRLHIPEDGSLVIIRQQQKQQAVIVKTDAAQALPILRFLVGPSEQALPSVTDVCRFSSKYADSTPCVPIANRDQLNSMLTAAKCLYKPRTDGMKALRLSRFEEGQESPAFAMDAKNDQSWIYSPAQMKSILNIYTVLDDDLIKLVFESITVTGDNKSYPRAGTMFQEIESNIANKFSLECDLLMTEDDELHFEAFCAQSKTRFITSAVEFTIPANNPGQLLRFALNLDKVIHESKKTSAWKEPYYVVQISPSSIYSSFQDLFISNISKYIIENTMPISIEAFLRKPGSEPAPESIGCYLIEKIISNRQLLAYAGLQDFLMSVYKPGRPLVEIKPEVYLEKTLGINIMWLYGDSALEDKLVSIAKVEEYLSDANTFNKRRPFIAEFHAIAIMKLIEPLIHKKTAADGGFYQLGYTEFDVLLTAQFCLRNDGRMSIQLKDNPGYIKHYAPNCKNHDICELEFKHLAAALKLNFALESDFHREMIFDHASTLVLKGKGLHINETNLQLRLNQAPAKLSVVSSSIFTKPAIKVAPEEKPNSEVLHQGMALTK